MPLYSIPGNLSDPCNCTSRSERRDFREINGMKEMVAEPAASKATGSPVVSQQDHSGRGGREWRQWVGLCPAGPAEAGRTSFSFQEKSQWLRGEVTGKKAKRTEGKGLLLSAQGRRLPMDLCNLSTWIFLLPGHGHTPKSQVLGTHLSPLCLFFFIH